MGNSASRARKLNQTLATTPVARTSQARLPPQALKQQFEADSTAGSASRTTTGSASRTAGSASRTAGSASRPDIPARPERHKPPAGPEGRDGMDPTADAAFIKSINQLGRQIQSTTSKNAAQVDVRALRQLMNRKRLFVEGQKEVEAQMAADGTRTMLHPRTLTAVLNALHDGRSTAGEIAQDYLVAPEFLEHMGRFRVAERIEVMEEHTKEDEIGPKAGRPLALMMDYDGAMGEDASPERLKELRKRLE